MLEGEQSRKAKGPNFIFEERQKLHAGRKLFAHDWVSKKESSYRLLETPNERSLLTRIKKKHLIDSASPTLIVFKTVRLLSLDLLITYLCKALSNILEKLLTIDIGL